MVDSTISRLAIDVTATPGHEFACVHITGDVDITSYPEFVEAMAQLSRLPCANVCIDLAGINFAGTALLTFLVRVINSVPPDTPVLLCRPSRITRHLLELSFLDTIATLCDELPPGAAIADHETG
jgi:anti-anti-sigma regulatory factor